MCVLFVCFWAISQQATQTVQIFSGCHVHGHQFEDPSCSIPPLNSDEYWIAEQWKRTREKIDHLKARGFIVLEMPACEWERRRKNDPEVRSYLTERFYPKNHRKTGNRMSSHDMLCAILRGDIFGLALVDIETPLALRNKFNILQPLILNRVVERSDLGPLMERYCLEKNLLNKPRRVLGQAFAARNLLLITPLLRWYLSHGLVVKKIHWIRQFTPLRPFQSIVEKVTECRKAADRDVSLKLQGNSMKLGRSAKCDLLSVCCTWRYKYSFFQLETPYTGKHWNAELITQTRKWQMKRD